MKKLIIILLLITITEGISFANDDASSLLKKAMLNSQLSSYIATAKIDNEQPIILTRFVDDRGNVFKKIFFCNSGNSIIKNTNGIFASINNNAKNILWASEISMWDDLYRDIHPDEWDLLSFSKSDLSYAKRSCYKIKVTLSDSNITKINKIGNRAKSALRPIRRVFIIDKDYQIILRRQHFDGNGRLTFDIGFYEITIEPEISLNDFPTPKNTDGKLYATLGAAQTKLAIESRPQKSFHSPVSNFWGNFFVRLWSLLLDYGAYFTIPIAILCIVGIIIIKKRERCE